MAINKVIYGNQTLLDLTGDTVTAATMVSGTTAHGADGENITGTLVIQHYYTGNSEPTSATGVNGDIYLQM